LVTVHIRGRASRLPWRCPRGHHKSGSPQQLARQTVHTGATGRGCRCDQDCALARMVTHCRGPTVPPGFVNYIIVIGSPKQSRPPRNRLMNSCDTP